MRQPRRIPRLILAELNATFYCLSAIKEEEKRPRGEDKEDLDGFHNDFLAMMSGMLSVNSSIHHFFLHNEPANSVRTNSRFILRFYVVK